MSLPCDRLYPLLRPLLFCADAERVHEATLAQLQLAHRLGLTALCRDQLPPDPVRAMGIDFPNPVGLAAGLDKNASCIDAFGTMGFGFVEAGTVTPQPQDGNPRPRLFRLAGAEALINRMGFNNHGLDAFVARVRASRTRCVLGLNIGKNAATPLERAVDDYRAGLRAVYPLAGYVTVNISSPNTRDLRRLQHDEALAGLLAALREERERLADTHQRRVPLVVKIAPDLDDASLLRLADRLVAHGVDGIIATNTTLARDGVAGMEHAAEAGGLSGRPLREPSTRLLARLAAHLQGALTLIGVGGILEGADAVEKIKAGAQLVQIYTGLIYRGPALVRECRQAIARHRLALVPGPGST